LNAQRTQQQALIGLVQAQATRYADTAALFQALGGGWWNRRDLPPSRPAPPQAKVGSVAAAAGRG
jgi:outer membrane protein TolC